MKKTLAVISLISVVLASIGLCGCGSGSEASYTVGICQLVQHPALDKATQGFKDVLKEEFGDAITFDEGNASGDSATCSTICNGFVSEGVDLIMANATPALQAAASATNSIPVLGTSISGYGVALGIDDFKDVVGGNISGTSDLAPMDEQANIMRQLWPDAKSVGIIFCSGEANSVFQVEVMTEELTKLGFKVSSYSFADSNDVSLVTKTACEENDLLYVPTDNVAASCADAINAVVTETKTPAFAAEEDPCKTFGVATLTIDYYELGRMTGKMAVKILKGEADISTMPVEYFANPVKKFNAEKAKLFDVAIPDDFEEIK